jgi:hypothetical protein
VAGTRRLVTKNLLLTREQIWLNLLFLHPKELIYNFLSTAGSSLGYKYTAEHLAKISGANHYMSVSVVVTDLNGFTVGQFDTVSAAAKFLGITHQGVCYAIKNKSVVQKQYLVVKLDSIN